jgi:hypothetical protein
MKLEETRLFRKRSKTLRAEPERPLSPYLSRKEARRKRSPGDRKEAAAALRSPRKFPGKGKLQTDRGKQSNNP